MPISFWSHLAPIEWVHSVSITLLLPVPTLPGQPFDPSLLLAQATSNVACSLTFGLRFPYDDKEFQAVVRAAGGVLLGISSPWGQVSGWDPSMATFLKGSCPPLPGNPQSTPCTCPCALMQGQVPVRTAAFSPQAYEMFSWLLWPLPGPRTQLLSHVSTLASFAVEQVQRHRGSLDISGPARDVVDSFLLKMAKVRG